MQLCKTRSQERELKTAAVVTVVIDNVLSHSDNVCTMYVYSVSTVVFTFLAHTSSVSLSTSHFMPVLFSTCTHNILFESSTQCISATVQEIL
jgi:hypothetical protein